MPACSITVAASHRPGGEGSALAAVRGKPAPCQLRPWELIAHHPGHTHLTDVEPKLRCRRCGNRAGNKIYVTVAAGS